MNEIQAQQRDKLVAAVRALVSEKEMPWTPAEIMLIRQRTPEDVDMPSFLAYLVQAARAGLNPIDNDIYAIPRFDKASGRKKTTIQVGIGGLRKVAQRTGRYMGMTEPTYYDADARSYGCWPAGDKLPHAIKIGVRVRDCAEPTWALVYMDEYKDGRNPQWAMRPVHMLTKVAEAHALRKVFPEATGFYLPEELGDGEDQGQAQRKPVENRASASAMLDDLPDGATAASEPKPTPAPEPEPVVEPAPTPVVPDAPADWQVWWERCQGVMHDRGFKTTAATWLIATFKKKHKVKDVASTTHAQRQEFWQQLHNGELDKFKDKE